MANTDDVDKGGEDAAEDVPAYQPRQGDDPRLKRTVVPGQRGRLKDARAKGRLTQKQLAEATGFSESLVQQWEAGVAVVSPAHAVKIASACSQAGTTVTVEDVLGYPPPAEVVPATDATVREAFEIMGQRVACLEKEVKELRVDLDEKLEKQRKVIQDALLAVTEVQQWVQTQPQAPAAQDQATQTKAAASTGKPAARARPRRRGKQTP